MTTAIWFFILLFVASPMIVTIMHEPPTALTVAIFTAYLVTLVFGSTHFSRILMERISFSKR